MITTILDNILTASGCDRVVYEQAQLANLHLDTSNPGEIVGVIIQPDNVKLEVRANAIHEHYEDLRIEVVQQVELEDEAADNESRLEACLETCKTIIVNLIASTNFKSVQPVLCNRVLENKYDANLIGWAMTLNLYYLKNENRC
jgi:hypothetical protein